MKPLIIHLNRFPGGKIRALTFSYDDGTRHDRRLIEILDAHGLKGTFHLNSSRIGQEEYLSPDDLRGLAGRHEISAHGVTHPNLDRLPAEQLAWEILEDRRALEEFAGQPVRGMSYPFGVHSPEVRAVLPSLGIRYSRTGDSHGRFHLPSDWLQWQPTCHHRLATVEKWAEFIEVKNWGRPLLFYVWGHSFEFPRDQNWDLIERFAERAACDADQVWFATNLEIYDYCQVVNRLEFSVDRRLVRNPSAAPAWISCNGEAVEIPGGETRVLAG